MMILNSIFVAVIMVACRPLCDDNSNGGNQMGQKVTYETLRHRMVETQLKPRGVNDSRVLEAMLNVKRHHFVPDNIQHLAYNDEPLPIGNDQTISQPYIVAYMTEVLKLNESDKVLEIGTGSGYQAAVLAEIVESVYSIEIVEPLGQEAARILDSEGYKNVHCRIGDGYQGWPEEAPFDAIIITAAPPRIPQPLLDQLKEGGRLIAPVGTRYQELILFTKTGASTQKTRLIPVRFVPMTGKIQIEKRP